MGGGDGWGGWGGVERGWGGHTGIEGFGFTTLL